MTKGFLSIAGLAVATVSVIAPYASKAERAYEAASYLSNPSGPMAVKRYVAPATMTVTRLAMGQPLPICLSAIGSVSYIEHGIELMKDYSDFSKTDHCVQSTNPGGSYNGNSKTNVKYHVMGQVHAAWY